jgi:hypothetical protein
MDHLIQKEKYWILYLLFLYQNHYMVVQKQVWKRLNLLNQPLLFLDVVTLLLKWNHKVFLNDLGFLRLNEIE